MQNYSRYIGIVLMLFIIAGCTSNKQSNISLANDTSIELTISAAVSLKESLEIIQKKYEADNPHVKLKFNYGSSGSLQQQISQGAPVDLFFSAAHDKFQKLITEGIITPDDSATLLFNELVVITPKENAYPIKSLTDLVHKEIDHISIGTPETVPAGKYAKEALEKSGLWNDLEPKLVFAKDVRQVLSYVETANVEAGIVYKTDALISDKIAIIDTIDSTTHIPIEYPVGIVKHSQNYEAAKQFLNYLQSIEAIEVFEEYGFITQ